MEDLPNTQPDPAQPVEPVPPVEPIETIEGEIVNPPQASAADWQPEQPSTIDIKSPLEPEISPASDEIIDIIPQPVEESEPVDRVDPSQVTILEHSERDNKQPPTSETPPKKDNNVWIIVIISLVILCCCCVVILIPLWFLGDLLISALGWIYNLVIGILNAIFGGMIQFQ